MANPKKVTLNMLVQERCGGLPGKISADNVIVDPSTGETLSHRLEDIMEQLGNNTGSGGGGDVSKLEEELKELIGDVPEEFNSLAELYNYMLSVEAAVNNLTATLDNKVDKVQGKGLSTNDFTDELKRKLEDLNIDGSAVTESAYNGNIVVNGTEVNVYTHPKDPGYMHIPAGGAVGNVLSYSSDGVAKWLQDVVVGGDAELEALEEGQLLFYTLDDATLAALKKDND